MRKIGGVFLSLTLAIILFIPGSMGNPIPQTVYLNSKTCGSPCPSDEVDHENLTIYLQKESIIAEINAEEVLMETEYIFCNYGPEEKEIDICLPFWNDPLDIDLRVNDIMRSFQKTRIDYEIPLMHQSGIWEYGTNSLECIIFKISVPIDDPVRVNVDYKSEPSSYDQFQNDLYFFSYLVGSARFWNHSIDDAYFEFRVDNEIYEKSDVEDWNITESKDHVVFDVTYNDWVPEYDFVGLSWEGNDSPDDENEELFSDIWEDDATRIGFLFLSLLIVTILILAAVFIVRVRRKNNRK